MPDRKNIIYCIQVDSSGHMANSHMLPAKKRDRCSKKPRDYSMKERGAFNGIS
jgi:hypothetical protein